MRKPVVIIVAIFLLLSIGLNAFLAYKNLHHSHLTDAIFPLLSDNIRDDNPTDDLIINVNDLRSALFQYTASDSAHIGIYFDYLPTNSTIGINQRQTFTLASLLKIPIAMAIYEKIAEETLSLDDTITITEPMLNKNYGSLWEKGAGTTISIKEALRFLLVESDNTASEALMSNISSEEVGRVFTSFDMSTLREADTLVITPKGYTSIFRSLYYSTHLPPRYSQEILSFLAESVTMDTNPLPIPSSIPVAHKIGVHDLTSTYSDCGIVYYPKHPYVYCIMVKDKPQEEASNIISSITNIIYSFIDTKANGN